MACEEHQLSLELKLMLIVGRLTKGTAGRKCSWLEAASSTSRLPIRVIILGRNRISLLLT